MRNSLMVLAASFFVAFFFAVAASAQVPSEPTPSRRNDSPPHSSVKPKCLPVRFSGDVLRDQRYVRALPGNLEFRLIPYPEGWSINIGRPGDKTEDYVGIATPPYHGVNPVFIEAWHFRNADNSGPNQGEVNAPTDVRDFSFVLNHAEYQKFFDALNLWSGGDNGVTDKQRDTATDFLLNGARRDGTLTITDMKLGGLGKGTRPWFESMKFNVNLCFPPAAPTTQKKSDKQALPVPNRKQ